MKKIKGSGNMTLTANYSLVLPKNYVSINETQMEYVDGGVSFSAGFKWTGKKYLAISISNLDLKLGILAVAQAGPYAFSALLNAWSYATTSFGGVITTAITACGFSSIKALCGFVIYQALVGRGVNIEFGLDGYKPYFSFSS